MSAIPRSDGSIEREAGLLTEQSVAKLERTVRDLQRINAQQAERLQQLEARMMALFPEREQLDAQREMAA